MLIKKFSQEYFSIWNEFVKNSKQGTFLLNRDYMDYHSDRFIDYSLMFYNEKDNLIALLPANIKDNILYSHQGLSYGGLIYGKEAKTIDILNCFQSLKHYVAQLNIKQLIYKRIPSVYYNYPADEDLYALFRNDAKLIRRDIGYVIDIQNQLKWNELRKRCLKKAIKENLIVKISQDYRVYHDLLSHILNISHDTKPVHSAEEMELLSLRFSDNIKLICCYRNNQIVSGVLLFIEKNTIHTQYIATSSEGKDFGAFEAIVNFLLNEFGDKKYLSFGISTENNGTHLNEGLAQQKESFGARGVCHDFYSINFNFSVYD
jgi:hypothetical protein